MQASRFLVATLRNDPAEASVASHRLMLRAGLVRASGSGLYHFLPMGLRVIQKIEAIVREEMNRAGAQEFLLPILTPAELWKRSGRWDLMGPEMFRVRDRHQNENALGPTHEEAFTELLSGILKSYRELPINVYQIHTKFRDEIRPRFGVIRSREFIMKDAYSFDLDEAGLEESYQNMRKTYRRIFERLGLRTIPVEADSGSMGGAGSEEFMVPSEIGEEVLLIAETGDYKGNQEKTPVIYEDALDSFTRPATQDASELELIPTPNLRSISEVAAFLKTEEARIMKALALNTDKGFVLVFMRGDRDLNEVKLKNHLEATELNPATDEEMQQLGWEGGFIGPLGLCHPETGEASSDAFRIVWDLSLTTGEDFVIGANQKDHHYKGYCPPPARKSVDVALARSGDPSPDGKGRLTETRGIEVGHIFKLGRKYSSAFEMKVQDPSGKAVTPIMGCYGIGINRSMATIIEQNHDELGIVWPLSVAPFEIALIGIAKGEEQEQKIRLLYEKLCDASFDVLYDDRPLRPGVKFRDAELIGYPIRLTAGKDYFANATVELVLRQDGKEAQKQMIPESELVERLRALKTKLGNFK